MAGPGRALMPAVNEIEGFTSYPVGPLERRGQQPADGHVGAIDVGLRQQDRELVAADAEGAVRPAQLAGQRSGERDQAAVARAVAALVVDPLEVIEIDHREGQRRAVPSGDHPLALELLLEPTVVAEAGQRVAQGLGPGPVVGVLEDDPGPLELFGGLQDAAGEIDHEAAETQRQRDDRERRGEQRLAGIAGQTEDDGSRDPDGDREHRHECEPQPEADEAEAARTRQERFLAGRSFLDERFPPVLCVGHWLYRPTEWRGQAPSYSRD